ncbi:MAG: Ig-like domain-containing protein [Ilumatobacteraceae bacterium]
MTRCAAVVAIGSGVVLTTVASGGVPAAHAAGLIDIRPETVINTYAIGDLVEGGGGLTYPNDCGSINVRPHDGSRDNDSRWEIRSSLGIGSTVYVGTTWTISGAIDVGVRGAGGNDGANPLNLSLGVYGPAAPGAAPFGGPANLQDKQHHDGNGFIGPVGAYGDYGYSFDEDSDPGLYGDGTNVKMTATLKATAPGKVQVIQFYIGGHDGTFPAGDVSCNVPLPGWEWNVIPATPPTAKADAAKTDATYTSLTPDANGGRHTVAVNVLANDDDPSTAGGVGSTAELRIADWSAGWTCGTPAQKNAVPSLVNFDALATGPCLFTPTANDEGDQVLSYTVVQKSNLREATTNVSIDVVPNNPPDPSDAVDELLENTVYAPVSLVPFLNDPESDPVKCSQALVFVSGETLGTATLDPACTFNWTSGLNKKGLVTITYTACDTHTLLTGAQMGSGVRGTDYTLTNDSDTDDLSENSSRRCGTGTIKLDIKEMGAQLGNVPKALNDIYTVDQGFPLEGLGRYNLKMNVLANDVLFMKPVKTVTIPIEPFPNAGAVSVNVDDFTINFHPGGLGTTSFTYVVCFVDDTVPCTKAKVTVTNRKNLAPIATADELGDVTEEAQVVNVALNDTEPDGENLACSTAVADLFPTPAAAFSSATIGTDCQLSFDPANDYLGSASITYRICDNHMLLTAAVLKDERVPYGDAPNNEQPGGPANRCSTGTVTMNMIDVVLAEPVPLPVNKPTCNADAFATKQNVELISDVLANDTDLNEQGVASPLTLPLPDVTDTTQGGTINVTAGKLQYLPKPGFVGVDTAIYNALDTNGQGCSAMVTYTVSLADNGGVQPIPPADPDPQMPVGGNLPATGASSPGIVIGAITLVLCGLALVVTSRRRRQPTTHH